MSDQRERIQLNLRLDGHKELYEAVKAAAAEQDTSVNAWVINAMRSALGWEPLNSPTRSQALEERLAVLEERLALVATLEERLTALETQEESKFAFLGKKGA
jgi:transposase-like protein